MNNSDRAAWLAIGIIVGYIIGNWGTISDLWTHRQQVSGAQQVLDGLGQMGVTF